MRQIFYFLFFLTSVPLLMQRGLKLGAQAFGWFTFPFRLRSSSIFSLFLFPIQLCSQWELIDTKWTDENIELDWEGGSGCSHRLCSVGGGFV
jgi:hypothetical protein